VKEELQDKRQRNRRSTESIPPSSATRALWGAAHICIHIFLRPCSPTQTLISIEATIRGFAVPELTHLAREPPTADAGYSGTNAFSLLDSYEER